MKDANVCVVDRRKAEKENEPHARYCYAMETTQKEIALITGGNCGLGLQTARELGRLGILTVPGVQNPDKSALAAEQLESEGLRAASIRVDVANISAHVEACQQLNERYGRLGILINNAGVWKESTNSSSYVPGINQTSSLAMEIHWRHSRRISLAPSG